MDLLTLGIDLQQGRASLTLRDAGGDRSDELEGPAFQRLAEAAAPLFARLGAAHGTPARLDLDAIAGELRLATAAGEFTLTGPGYAALRPLLREPARLAVREARPRPADPPGIQGDAAVWDHKYQVGGDGWELMRPAPPLGRFLAAHPPPPGTRALVPGCGRGHEARLLGRLGASVTAIDIAPSGVRECRRLVEEEGLGGRVEVEQLDLFALPPAHRGRYDLVLEHCCFCAIDPARRNEYVATVAAALRPGGRFLGLFWCHDYPGGPPYGATQEEVERRFAARFATLHAEVPADSILTRSDKELLLLLEKKDAL